MTWLQVEYETLPWASSTQELSRRAARNSPRTYESALVSPIAQAELELPSDTLALVERATIAATRFDATEAHPPRHPLHPASAAQRIGGVEQNRAPHLLRAQDPGS